MKQGEEMVIPKIGFKAVFVFMLIVATALFLFPPPLIKIGLSVKWSLYLTTSLSSTFAMTVAIAISSKERPKKPLHKRLFFSAVVCLPLSFVVLFL